MSTFNTLALLGLGGAALYFYSKSKEVETREQVRQALPPEPTRSQCEAAFPERAGPVEQYDYLVANPGCIEQIPIEALQQLADRLNQTGAGELAVMVQEWVNQLTEQLQP